MKKIIVLLVLVALGSWAGYSYLHSQSTAHSNFRTADVKRGPLVATVSSTGTLQPRELVDIGAQVLGPIIYIGKDSNTQSGIVDWGSEVEGPVFDKDGKVIKPGTLLAQIDPALYDAAVKLAEAQVASAKADLLQKTATLKQATLDWGRAQRLYPTGGVAKAEYDQFQAAFGVATANIGVSEANIGVAKANLKTAQTNLDYTRITSPVKGVVIDRRVNMGQTVVASLSAPSLFLIAKDLSKMEVWATVNEVDVGKIKVGQDVNFTVDAFTGKVFTGKVVPQGRRAPRLNAAMNQNVVTYTVVVSADNKDNLLYPYLTTNLSFIIEDTKDALLVPNAALRWQPSKKQIAADQRDAYEALRGKKRTATDVESQDRGFVWVEAPDGSVRYLELRLSSSDTVNTVVKSVLNGELTEHARVIIGEGKADVHGSSANPFTPQMFKPKAKE